MSCTSCPAKALLDKTDKLQDNNPDESCGKLDAYDWLKDLPVREDENQMVEIQFKNTRKAFFINKNKISIQRDNYVAVSAQNGHDIGRVTLTGKLALMQLKRKKPRHPPEHIIYRKATPIDLEKWHKARLREKPTMIRARKLVEQLGLEMKISDVEFQGDGTKATFYYLAEGRVDFRELIKHYAKEFRVKVEMKQIGARQEAAMIGGIGSCGNTLCCSSWRTNLESVSATAAKVQELPHNVQKLTGQCGKLKCCLMYELDTYIEAQKDFPDMLLELETEQGMAYPRKKDVLQKVVWYSLSKTENSRLVALSLDKVKEIIMLNKKGVKVASLSDETAATEAEPEYKSFENDFDILKKKRKKRRKGNFRNNRKK